MTNQQLQLTSEERAKRAQIEELQLELQQLHDKLKAAAKEKPMHGLPEISCKRFCNDDNDSLTAADEESIAFDQQPE